MPDPNARLLMHLDGQLAGATCKGVVQLTNDTCEVEFEKDGKPLTLALTGDRDGLDVQLREGS